MPRPVKDDPRDKFKSFRFTGAEVTRLEGRARASGQSLSDYVRARILNGSGPEETPAYDGNREGAEDRSSRTDTPEAEGQARLLAEQLRRIGVNLNQIARHMNEHHLPPPPEFVDLLDDIRGMVRRARQT